MKVELIGLGKLDAIELQRQLGNAAVRSDEIGRSVDTPQDLGTAGLLLIALSPQIIAGAVAWLLKPRQQSHFKLTFRSTLDDGRFETLEIDASELTEEGLDPRVLEKLSKVTRLPIPDLKDAITKQFGKADRG
jgi:hypothetical protein